MTHHQTYTLSCKTMTCGGCEKTIEDALKKVANVQSVKADSNAGTITVVAASCNSCKDGCSCCKCNPCKCDPCRWYGALPSPPLFTQTRVCARVPATLVYSGGTLTRRLCVHALQHPPHHSAAPAGHPPSQVLLLSCPLLLAAESSPTTTQRRTPLSTHTCNRSSRSKFSASCHAQPHSLASLDAHLVAAAARAA
jgi:copper chaperone CopZ